MSDFVNNIKSKIIRIGNSHGLRIPQSLLKQLRLDDEVEMTVENDTLIIRSARRTRYQWDEKFAQVLTAEVETTEDLAHLTDWDGAEWQW